jgi:hypothetical protein
VRITHGGVAGKDPKAEGGGAPRGLKRLGGVRVPQEANAARGGTSEPMPVPSQGCCVGIDQTDAAPPSDRSDPWGSVACRWHALG